MPYYAPFTRPVYQNEVSPYPYMGQPMQQPVQQPIGQPAPQMQQPSTGLLWVLGETEATSYPVAPNNTVILWDNNAPTVYIKSVNAQGVPSMRVLDFTERTATSHTQPQNNQPMNFPTMEQFKALQGEVAAMGKKINAITNQEVEANG